MTDLRVHRIPFSTNVERIAIAAALTGIAVQWVDHDPADRSAVRALSGQDLVPVAQTSDGEVIVDSTAILRWIDETHPTPPLWPVAPRPRAQADVFVDWFNGVWKVAPNAIADALEAGAAPDPAHVRTLERSVGRFDALLDGRDFLLGDAPGIADVIAFPFLVYGLRMDPADPDRFHHVLHEHLAGVRDRPRLTAWIARVDAIRAT